MSIVRTYIVPHPPLIIPDIGKGKEKLIKKTIDSYNKIGKEIAKIKPKTIIISSPHSTLYSDYFHISPHDEASGDFGYFGADDVKISVKYDHDLRLDIINNCKDLGFPAGIVGEKFPELDHGTLIPLFFIEKYYHDFKVIRISPSGMAMIDHYNLGRIIKQTIPEDYDVVWIASGDLSHKLSEDGPYGIAEEGFVFDNKLQEVIRTTNFNDIFEFNPDFCNKAAECGLGSISMMLGSLDGFDVKTKILSYENTFGVGYMVAELIPQTLNPERNFADKYYENTYSNIVKIRNNEDEYVRLARMALEYYIRFRKAIKLPDDLSSNLLENKAGVFVSLHIKDSLRGCIGTIYPATESIASEIIHNAISAGTKDHRFSEVKQNELDQIVYNVDVLMKPEKIDSVSELDVEKYGIIVRSNFKTGVLLPNIEGVNTVKEQIDIAKRKAGIDDYEDYSIERFEVIRHY